jgi:hypothetical protein
MKPITTRMLVASATLGAFCGGFAVAQVSSPGTAPMGAAHDLSATPGVGGFFMDQSNASRVYRFRDRVMVGDSVLYTGNRRGTGNGYGTSWITENAASWFIKNSVLSASSEAGNAGIGVLGASRTAPGVTPGLTNAGVAALSLNEGNNTFGRAIYAEAMHKATGRGGSAGIEIQVGNWGSSSIPVANAYTMGASSVNGLYIGAESGHGYTVGNGDTPIHAPTHPAGASIDISGGSLGAAYQKWVTGIVFRNGALVRDGANFAVAASLAQKHKLQWQIDATTPGARIWSEVTAGTQQVGLSFQNRRVKLLGHNDRTIVDAIDDTSGAGAVNWLVLKNSRAGLPAAVGVDGADGNVNLDLYSKGAGAVRMMSHAGAGENLRITSPAAPPTDYLTVAGTAGGGVANVGAAGASPNIGIVLTPKGSGIVSSPAAMATATHFLDSSAAPAASGCGARPVVTPHSTNHAGQFTLGSGAPTACTITFANAFPTAAFCSVTAVNTAAVGTTVRISASSASAFTVTLGAGTDGAQYNYVCMGK